MVLANCNRDADKRSSAYEVEDFLPQEFRTPKPTPEEALETDFRRIANKFNFKRIN